jgi:DNA-binding transcriptional LysR family regulator
MSLLHANLQAFLAVHRCKTVMAASRVLGLGQTGVTQRIRGLERELGVTLFTRSRMGMTLTAEGEALLAYCAVAVESEARILNGFKGGGKVTEVELRVAGPTSFLSARVIQQCKGLFKAWPQLNLHFHINDSATREELLKRGLADIVALSPHQVPLECDSKLLVPDAYMLVGHPSWEGWSLQKILAEQRLFAFHPDDATSLTYLQQFGLLRYLKRPRLYVNENFALQQLLMAGAGIGILLTEIAAPLLRKRRLIALNDAKIMKDPIALAWYPRTEMPAYFRAVIDAIH